MSTDDAGAPREHEREEAIELFLRAFPSRTRASLESTPLDQFFVARDQHGLTFVARWDYGEVAAYGNYLPLSIRGAATARPGLRERGLSSRYLSAYLALLRSRGCVLFGTHTHLQRMARRFEAGTASTVRRYLVTPSQLRPAITPSSGRLDVWPTASDLAAVERVAHMRRFGLLRRDSTEWDLAARRYSGQAHRAGAVLWRGANEEPEGYVLYRYLFEQPGITARSGVTRMIVDELVAHTPQAYLGLISFLSEQTTVTTLRWDAPADDLLDNVVENFRHVPTEVRADKIVRIVDLERLTLPVCDIEADKVDGIHIAVDDNFASWNRGPWRVVIDNSVVRFERVSTMATGGYHIPVSTLASLVTGHLDPHLAWRCGLLPCIAEADLHRLSLLFPRRMAPYCPQPW